MTQITNLNRYRKEKARHEAEAKADTNAAKHGRTKAQRLLDVARADKAKARLDQHKFDDE